MPTRPIWSALSTASCVAAACISVSAAAEAAGPAWNGRYSVVTYASQKTGSSGAARQPESDFSAQFDFVTDCSSGRCIATANGPAPSNPTIPRPAQYGWDGSRWLSVYTWQWECYRGETLPREYAPARSQVFYAPSDGSLFGTWQTEILSGACRGTVVMPVVAYPG
ncbi:Rv2253 family sensor-like surface protein [Mycobacterium sp. URHB0021]|jgi:hypothetical protein